MAFNILIIMEPNEQKEYPQLYMPQYQYPPEYQGVFQGEFPQMQNQQLPGNQMMPGPRPMNSFYPQPQPQVPYPPNMAGDLNQNSGNKGKRRSKNEPEGRNYKCKQCDRTYLSYPALYTHIKTKHTAPGVGSLHTGRGRGRPKKSVRPQN